MENNIRRFHLEVLSTHKQKLYDTLLYDYNITSGNLKMIDFDEYTDQKGYFAKKENVKYWIPEQLYDSLPFKVGNHTDEVIYNDDVVYIPLRPTPFKISSEKTMDIRKLIDEFAPFEHSNPEHWRLLKIIGLMGYIKKTYICISSNSNFGKTSIFDLLHGLTDKVPVFKPRSVPGVLNKITGNGNIVFDEIHDCNSEVRRIIEEFSLSIGGNKAVYINGALESKNTKPSYPCPLQSITFLYNDMENYSNPQKEYFDVIFSNNLAIDDRFLKIKFNGNLTQLFTRDFNIIKEAEENKMYYIDIAKMLNYLQELKLRNGYQRRFDYDLSRIKLSPRQKNTFDEITWLIDMYSYNENEYNRIVDTLIDCILDYRGMINGMGLIPFKINEEIIEEE